MKIWGKLYLENLKLLSIEKSTVLFGHAALAGVLAVLSIIAFFFISLALVFLLAQVLPLMWSFLKMCIRDRFRYASVSSRFILHGDSMGMGE